MSLSGTLRNTRLSFDPFGDYGSVPVARGQEKIAKSVAANFLQAAHSGSDSSNKSTSKESVGFVMV
ncbi:hypothetical protein N7449_009578 [Penicillium cf. viridicatum]|uniref:Uncharacterized protein n=1 Tax=Penicillium cf. viridicatum TaxID=2972119 RepID=A0A9W9M864_9EURO|nr:hypothetical protein N7449_009578 [Penicillium cf. viridicatum]